MTIRSFRGSSPDIHPSCYVAPNATVIGRVRLDQGVSIWPNAVLRGDNDHLTIGEGSNVQDGAVVHLDLGFPVRIGKGVTVGHQACLHGCTVGDDTLIGIQAVVLNGAVIGERSLVAAGALVVEGVEFPAGSLIVGRPAKLARALSAQEQSSIVKNGLDYARLAAEHGPDAFA